MLCTLAAIAALAAGADAAPAVAAATEAAPRWQLSVAAWSARPAVLPGLALGVTADGVRRAGGPTYLFARLGYAQSSAENVAWIIDHHQLVAALGGGVSASEGVARLFAQAGVGVSGIYEVLSRHQAQRISTAGVPGGTVTDFTVGPYGLLELGLALQLRGGVSALFALGPELTRTEVQGGALLRLGGSARLGVAYDF